MKKTPVPLIGLLSLAVLVFASCGSNAGYRKTKSGILYKIFTDGKKAQVKTGNVLRVNFAIKLGTTDSLLRTTYGRVPVFIPLQGPVPPESYSPAEIFDQLHDGDSAVVVQLADSILKHNPNVPPFIKKGERIITTIKVLQVYPDQQAAQADQTAAMEKQKQFAEQDMKDAMAKQDKEVTDDLQKYVPEMESWLAKNNIKAAKVGRGTFVLVKEPGTGMLADSGKFVTVRYEGRRLEDNKVFQSTLDTASQPFTFQVGTKGAIPGWDEALPLFKKGGKGTIYIPGPLAYGRNPQPGSPFKPNDALIFDIVVVDVADKQPVQPQQTLPPQLREAIEKQQKEKQK